ncbi:MAG: BatD family protein [Bacteroidales bacterium]
MKKSFSGILFLMLLTSFQIAGQEVSFRASSKNVVRVGERFQLVYTLNAEGQNFRGPDIKGLNIVGGPSTSQSSSIQIIQGQVTRSVENSYTYILQAGEEGIFDIPPARITVDGKTYESNPLKVQVVKSPQQQQQGGSPDPSGQGADQDFSNDVFIRAVVNKTSPYQGEQVIVTYKLYYKINISGLEFTKEPSYRGFWMNDLLKDRKNFAQYQETYKGSQYQVAEVKKIALFPQQSGKLTIPPLEGRCKGQVRAATQRRTGDPFFDSFFNDPFFNRFQTVDIPLESNPLSIDVKPLPSSGKPADYSGAVGQFEFASTIDKTDLKANEAINLQFTISGTGNVELIDRVNVKFPPGFEVYDPKISKNIQVSPNGISGRKTFEYLLIPRNHGNFRIDPVSFTFFDLSKQGYVTLKSPGFDIAVAKGEGTATDLVFSGTGQTAIQYLGSDIRYIRTNNPALVPVGNFFFGSDLFYMLIALPFLLFILFILIWKKELKKRSNIALMRNRKATRVARKRMKQAEIYMKENQKDRFFVEVSQALWGYLSDKFSIPLASLSMDTVTETLTHKELKPEIIEQFIETLNHCEFARFAPGESQTAMDNIFHEAISVITLIEKELK